MNIKFQLLERSDDLNQLSSKDDVLYTVAEVAKLIKTSVNNVYALIKAGLLPVLKLGGYKIRKVALDDFLAKWEGWDLTDPFNPVEINRQKF